MPCTTHIATIAAYPIDADKGGGFRGVYKMLYQNRVASPRFETLAEAKFWAKSEAHNRYAGNYQLAAMKRKGEYLANVWVAVKEEA